LLLIFWVIFKCIFNIDYLLCYIIFFIRIMVVTHSFIDWNLPKCYIIGKYFYTTRLNIRHHMEYGWDAFCQWEMIFLHIFSYTILIQRYLYNFSSFLQKICINNIYVGFVYKKCVKIILLFANCVQPFKIYVYIRCMYGVANAVFP
jgi:hypothetical protein